MSNPYISRLRIYPVKSLSPVEVEEATIGIHSLQNDRLFAMIDESGRFVNGKRTPRVNHLEAKYDLSAGLIFLTDRNTGNRHSFLLEEGNAELDGYLSDFFDLKLRLVKNTRGEFMDIPAASSVTIVSEASLQSLQQDLDQHSLEDMRLRFRTNIELGGAEAFWEERLFLKPGFGLRFRVGEVEMIGITPRARCNVPPQSPVTGETDEAFVRNMIASRNRSLPEGSTLPLYGRTTYFLTVNVFLPATEKDKRLKLNDRIEIIEPISLE